ncbi:hypothetical protein PUR59_04385 [Streptomyces sp. SP18ES09]|uniref:hypothetical protein n=1 Tax=Streptomyces sp. SP18ES09 TaxID=3002532 RepID=UPI002E78BC3B|nr:hypothetical protein [Streptomyces sp. SP18ES09]MEE1814259.1 hypothetical protein [Streptomyces sp. SP18ES09]
MTGPEHYREAEQHLGFALNSETDREAETHCAIAQVHATLALSAATALSDPALSGPPSATVPEWDAWQKAAGVAAQEDDR